MSPGTAELSQRLEAFVATRSRELALSAVGSRRSGAEVVFAAELQQRPASERPLLRAALESAAGPAAWELASASGRDPAAVMRRSLEDLLLRT